MSKLIRLFSFVLFGCLFSIEIQASPSKEENKKTALVFAEVIKKTELFDTLSYPARILSKVNSNILADTDGILTQITSRIGQPVKKGTVLARIKTMDPIYDYVPARVLAPVPGVVSSVDFSEGSHVSRGQKIMTIMDPAQLIIAIEVAQKDLKHISSGLKGTFSYSGALDTLSVAISGVSPFVDPMTGTATAELKPESPVRVDPTMGALGQVSFKVNSKEGLQLPEAAIAYQGNKTFVRVIEKGLAKYAPVELGETRKGYIEILKGVSDGTQVIVRSSQFISEGDPVTVSPASEPHS